MEEDEEKNENNENRERMYTRKSRKRICESAIKHIRRLILAFSCERKIHFSDVEKYILDNCVQETVEFYDKLVKWGKGIWQIEHEFQKVSLFHGNRRKRRYDSDNN